MFPGAVRRVKIRDIPKCPQFGPPETAQQSDRQFLGTAVRGNPQRAVSVPPDGGLPGAGPASGVRVVRPPAISSVRPGAFASMSFHASPIRTTRSAAARSSSASAAGEE